MIVAGLEVNTTTISSLVGLSEWQLNKVITWVHQERERNAERGEAAVKAARKVVSGRRAEMETEHEQQAEWARRHFPEG